MIFRLAQVGQAQLDNAPGSQQLLLYFEMNASARISH